MLNCKRIALTVAGSMTLAALAAPAMAQLSPDHGPVNVSADHNRNETDKTTGYDIIYLDGRVEINQDGRRLRCDHAKIVEAPHPGAGPDSSKDIVQMEATGNVYYVAEDQNARGDYGIYTKADDTLKVTGNVILQRGQSVATGNLLIDHVNAGDMSLTSDAGSANKGRVRAVMYTDKKDSGTAAPKH